MLAINNGFENVQLNVNIFYDSCRISIAKCFNNMLDFGKLFVKVLVIIIIIALLEIRHQNIAH
jgi:hypothetical protein